jgi:hypothetical protein
MALAGTLRAANERARWSCDIKEDARVLAKLVAWPFTFRIFSYGIGQASQQAVLWECWRKMPGGNGFGVLENGHGKYGCSCDLLESLLGRTRPQKIKMVVVQPGGFRLF